MAEWIECRTPDYRDRGSNLVAGRWFGTDTATVSILTLPTNTGQGGMVGEQYQHAMHYNPMAPVASGTEGVGGGGSGQLGLRAGGSNNLWVTKSRRQRVSRLKIARYTVRTLPRDEHIHELEEELMEARLVWDIIGI